MILSASGGGTLNLSEVQKRERCGPGSLASILDPPLMPIVMPTIYDNCFLRVVLYQ